jgi:HK97 family phage major capsid protein
MTKLSPEQIAKRLAAVPEEEQAAELGKIAQEAGVATPEPSIILSEEEQSRLVSGIIGEAKKVVEERAKEVEQRYSIPHGEAVALVEDAASKGAKERILKNQKYDIIGRRMAAALRSNGAPTDALKRTAEEEAGFLKKHYSAERAERAMSLADNTAGGSLAPEMFEAEVYHNIQETALNRRYCEVKEIPRGMEIKKWPTITSDLTAAVKAEGAAANESSIVTGTFDLDPKAIVALSGPITIDLLEASAINIVDHLIKRASAVMAKKEDEYLFTGDGNVNWNGLINDAPSGTLVTMADTNTAITNVTFDNLIDMEYALDDHYIPDVDDVTGSGSITGEAFYWFHRAAYKTLKKLKAVDSGVYHFAIEEMMRDKTVSGNRFRRVPYLPSAPAAATRFGLFGNLKYTWVGVRPGIQMELATQGEVGGVNLFKTGQKAIRFIEFWDYALVDTNSISAIRTAAS